MAVLLLISFKLVICLNRIFAYFLLFNGEAHSNALWIKGTSYW